MARSAGPAGSLQPAGGRLQRAHRRLGRGSVAERRAKCASAGTRHLRQRCRSVLQGPPEGYDYRDGLGDASRAVVAAKYPELLDLIDEGSLFVVRRPEDYVERRTDGYQEPKEVFLVATAHLSRKSCEDVERTIAAVQPENVVVELCRSRSGLMYETPASSNASNPMNLSGTSFISAMARSSRLGGQSALFLRLLLGQISKRMSDQVGLDVGGEMRAAQAAASELSAQVVLGDRPIEITLQRAWDSLPWRERLQLAATLVRGLSTRMPELDEATVESLKQDDVVNSLFFELGAQYPTLLTALVHERDLYLAWSLKRSKAVNGTERVVGVIGRGHLRGVVYALTTDSGSLRFRDLVGGKNTRASKDQFARNAGKRIAWELALGAGFLAILSAVTS